VCVCVCAHPDARSLTPSLSLSLGQDVARLSKLTARGRQKLMAPEEYERLGDVDPTILHDALRRPYARMQTPTLTPRLTGQGRDKDGTGARTGARRQRACGAVAAPQAARAPSDGQDAFFGTPCTHTNVGMLCVWVRVS
jgi:hypothetical protein